MTAPATRFRLPDGAEATGPPESRGLARDGVRLLVARPSGIRHATFGSLTDVLDAGDVLVVNTSATLPAAIDSSGGPVHVSTELDGGEWVVELRKRDGSGPNLDVEPGDVVHLPGGVDMTFVWPYPDPDALRSRLWRADVSPPTDRTGYLARHGHPIQYRYLTAHYPIADFQTVYAAQPGSAEMASAGRPFTPELLVALMAHGVTVAPITLHAGVSSPELHEPPMPEWFDVPASTARIVNGARADGRRVVAVGTTAVRAVESASGADGVVHPARGWTGLVLGPNRPARTVNGLVTGLHEPEASHLLLLEAVAGVDLVKAAYAEAVEQRYLWHEFGDSMIFLP